MGMPMPSQMGLPDLMQQPFNPSMMDPSLMMGGQDPNNLF
jgi:hypothetical protein